MTTANARLDPISQQVVPADTGHWDNTPTTWDLFTTWYIKPTLPMVYQPRLDDLVTHWPWGTSYNLKIETDADGLVGYEVTTYDANYTLLSTTVINPGDQNVPAFTGEYFNVLVVVTATSQTPTIRSIQVTASNQMVQQTTSGVNTSTLPGTITARQLPLYRKFGSISNITIDVREVTAYAVDVYVTNTPTSQTVIPRTVSMDRTTPTIALVGIDNHARDAVVDFTITGLASQYMSGNNLYLR